MSEDEIFEEALREMGKKAHNNWQRADFSMRSQEHTSFHGVNETSRVSDFTPKRQSPTIEDLTNADPSSHPVKGIPDFIQTSLDAPASWAKCEEIDPGQKAPQEED